jgi:hypothetical protein
VMRSRSLIWAQGDVSGGCVGHNPPVVEQLDPMGQAAPVVADYLLFESVIGIRMFIIKVPIHLFGIPGEERGQQACSLRPSPSFP